MLAGFVLFCLSLPVATWAQGAGPLRCVLLAGATVPLVATAARLLLGRGSRAPQRLDWDPDGQFSLVLADGRVEAVQLQPGSLASSRWLWLVLRGSNHYHLFVDRQRSDPGAFAAIRRRLRTFPQAGGL